MRRGRRIGLALVALIAIGGLGIMCQRVGERGRFSLPYSTYGSGPEGARALFLLTAEAGLEPVRWSRDLANLPDDGMLVALGGCDSLMARPVSRYERQTLEQWVREGGVLVVAGAHQYLWPQLGVHMWRPTGECDPELGLVGSIARAEREGQLGDGVDGGVPPPPPEQRARDAEDLQQAFEDDPVGTVEALSTPEELPAAQWARPTAPPLSGLGAVPLRKPAWVVVSQPEKEEATTVLELPRGPAGVILRRGEGAIVALASASMLQNREIDTADGGVLFTRLARELAPEGPVLFDEYHLGAGERRSLTAYLRSVGGGALGLQVLVVAVFLLWRAGTRFGAPRRKAPPLAAGTASYVSAIGTLYAKSGDARGAIQLLARHALSRVAEHHHLASAGAEALAKDLEERQRVNEAAAVRELGTIAREPYTEKRQLVARARRVDELVEKATRENR